MKKNSLWMKIAVVYTVIVCFITNVLFYGAKYGLSLAMFSYSIQNILASFTLSSKLGLSDVMGLKELLSGIENLPAFLKTDLFHTILVNAYGVSTLLAPLCTIGAMLLGVEMFVRRLILRSKVTPEGSTVVFGWSDTIKELVKHERDVVIISTQSQTVEALREMEKRNIQYHEFNAADDDNMETLLKLKPENASRILLMEKDDFTNLTIYMKLMESGLTFKEDCLLTVECREPLAAQLFKNYYREKKCHPINLFLQQELAADALIRQYPIEEYVGGAMESESGDAHILIAGFGKTGQAVLDRFLGEAILASDSHVYIDVIDKDAVRFREEFLTRLDGDYGTVTDDSFRVENPNLDGVLEVRFVSMDLTAKATEEFLKKRDIGYDYAAICLADAQTGINTALKINDHAAVYGWNPFPILVVQDTDTETSKYLHTNDGQYQNIHYVEITRTLDDIFRKDEEDRAREFNRLYNRLSILSAAEYEKLAEEEQAEPEDTWNTMDYFKQVSSRKAANHQRVKEYILKKKYGEDYIAMIKERFGENGTILMRKGTRYVMNCADDNELVEKINADAFAREMAMLEHKRWNVSMAIEGWSYAPKKNVVKKETPYLRDWDTLCKESPWVCVYDLMPVLYIDQKEKDRPVETAE